MSELESVSDRPNHQAETAPISKPAPTEAANESFGAPSGDNSLNSNGAAIQGEVGEAASSQAKKRRRGSRGGRGRGGTGASRPHAGESDNEGDEVAEALASGGGSDETNNTPRPPKQPRPPRQPGEQRPNGGGQQRQPRPTANSVIAVDSSESVEPELPDRPSEGRVQDAAVAERVLVPRKPQIGDSMPAPVSTTAVASGAAPTDRVAKGNQRNGGKTTQQSGGQQSGATKSGNQSKTSLPGPDGAAPSGDLSESKSSKRRRGGRSRTGGEPSTAEQKPQTTRPQQSSQRKQSSNEPVQTVVGAKVELDDETFEKRRGRERNGRPVGRYLMCVQVRAEATQVAVLEGRHLIEHYVSLPQDDVNQIHGNIYLGKVNNVLPGMEAAFVDISTPKNAVLYRGDAQFDQEDVDDKSGLARIEQMLRNKQLIVCQVTKNPIGLKGARLTQEVSLPGRFVVLVPHSRTYGISKRLPDDERKRQRNILDRVKPSEHGLIVRTAAEGANAEELRRDVKRLISQWDQIEELAERARRAGTPRLLYREPSLAVRVIREELSKDYRGVIIDDAELYNDVKSYVDSVSPELSDRVEHYDRAEESLPIYERFHIVEQLHKAIDRKVWLPSGGSLIIERTEALTVIDVNTGKNVGTSSLEQTVYKNNLEAADEIARQLRLRDIGGIIVIDFIDMEVRSNRDSVIRTFRDALARDKTRTQVFDISDLGLVEMTRKRIGEGLLESLSHSCEICDGRGFTFNPALINPDD